MTNESKQGRGIVIVGAGQSAHQLAVSLRDGGYSRPILIVGDEPHPPYQRPPLSKAYLQSADTAEKLYFAPANFYGNRRIDIVCDCPISEIDRARRVALARDGRSFAYDHLVFATGARNRDLWGSVPLPDGVISMRGVWHAEQMRIRLAAAKNVVVIGGGFLGLEFACVARKRGANVHVVEASNALMSRSVRPPIAESILDVHRKSGITFHLGAISREIEAANGHIVSVLLENGTRLPADLVVVSVGVVANSELAVAARLPVSDGIIVDGQLATIDPDISALGDCARFPSDDDDRSLRLESVQNAVDQARFLAARLTGRGHGRYRDVPWFWSDQGSIRLHIAGLTGDADEIVMRGAPAEACFAALCFRGGRFIGVEAVNSFGDYRSARRILERRVPLRVDQARQPGFRLADFASAHAA